MSSSDRVAPTVESQLALLIDRDEIRELSHRYSQAADLQDYEMLSTIFTQDGALSFEQPWADGIDAPTKIYRGTEALRTMPRPPLHRGLHVVANMQIATLGDDDATGVVYFMRLMPDGNGGIKVSNAGIYRDRYRRTPAGWGIAWRDILPLPADGLPADAFLPLEH